MPRVRIGRLPAFAAAAALAMASAATSATLSVQVDDASSGRLPDAVVYLLPAAGKAPVRPQATVVIDQIARQFSPTVAVVQTGTLISFPNKDNIRHQVYSFSLPKIFELKLYSGVPSQPVLFDKPGLVVMGCNIHDRMVGFVQVVDTPWFGKSGPDGVARIEALPPGEYLVHAWHFKLGDRAAVATPVRVGADLSIRVVVDIASKS